MRIAVIGGTGSFGGALARRLDELGEHEVVIGSRDPGRAEAAAARLGPRASGAENGEAVARVELAVLAVAAEAALETARGLASALGETPLLSVASLVCRGPAGLGPDPEALSLAERVQRLVDGPVVAGLHSLAAGRLAGPPSPEDAFICGDETTSKELALSLAGRLVSGRALDAGPLASARTLEGLTSVLLTLNHRFRTLTGLSVTGIPEQ